MKKRMLLTCALMFSATVFAAPAAKLNQDVGQGVDSEVFLAPYLESEIKDVAGRLVLDTGSGAAPRAVAAAQNGAVVCAVEAKQSLLTQAQTVAARTGVESQISFSQGNAESIPFESNVFDQALCVNVGTALPSTMHVITQDSYTITGLGAHFREVARVLKDGGRAVISAPASFGVVFTDGTREMNAVNREIDHALTKIGRSEDPAVITKNLSELSDIHRATFARRDGKLQLITDDKELSIGEQVWCKIPGGVISTYFHSEEEFLVSIKKAGLHCEEIKRPCFFGNVKRKMWHDAHNGEGPLLGEAYVDNHPFTLYYVVKKA